MWLDRASNTCGQASSESYIEEGLARDRRVDDKMSYTICVDRLNKDPVNYTSFSLFYIISHYLLVLYDNLVREENEEGDSSAHGW